MGWSGGGEALPWGREGNAGWGEGPGRWAGRVHHKGQVVGSTQGVRYEGWEDWSCRYGAAAIAYWIAPAAAQVGERAEVLIGAGALTTTAVPQTFK